MQRRASGRDSGAHCLKVSSTWSSTSLSWRLAASFSLSVHSCCLADEVVGALSVDGFAGYVALRAVFLYMSAGARSSSTTVTCAWQVLLVTMHITLCSLCFTAGLSHSALWLLWNRRTVCSYDACFLASFLRHFSHSVHEDVECQGGFPGV